MRFRNKNILTFAASKKSNKMHKLTFTFLFIGLMAIAGCYNNPGLNNQANAGAEGQVIHMTTASFQQLVWDYKANPQAWLYRGDKPCIIDFYADWCRPCKMVAPIMDELAAEYKGKVTIYNINIDEQRELAGMFNITSIPAVIFIPKSGKPQVSVGAMQKSAYVEMIQNVLMVQPGGSGAAN